MEEDNSDEELTCAIQQSKNAVVKKDVGKRVSVPKKNIDKKVSKPIEKYE